MSSPVFGFGFPGLTQIRGQYLGSGPPQLAPQPKYATDPAEDLRSGILELEKVQQHYAKASAYYDGHVPEYFASMRMRIAMGATSVVFNFNFGHLPVDAVAERLEIAGISCTDTSVVEMIESIWRSNQLDVYGPDVMQNACKFGDAYLMVWPDPDGDVDGDGIPDVNIFYQSPKQCRVFYEDDNERKKRYAIKRWEQDDYIYVNLYYPDRIEKYIQEPEPREAIKNDEVLWEKRIDEPGEEWPLPNPFNEVPIFHFRNAFPYGEPEHYNAYGPQDAIHKLVISHMAAVDYNAFPQRYAIIKDGYDTSEAAFGDEGEFTFSLQTSATQSGIMDPKSQLTADPASVWFMKGIEGYGQFPPGDPEAFLRPFERYIHAMAVVTNTPMHFMDPIVSNVSGESLRLIEAPFAKKVRNRQMMFGTAWRDLWRFVMRVLGKDEQLPIRINWVPASTVNDLSTLQGQLIKVQLGVPQYQILLEQGYTPEQLDQWDVSTTSLSPEDTGLAQGGEVETGSQEAP